MKKKWTRWKDIDYWIWKSKEVVTVISRWGSTYLVSFSKFLVGELVRLAHESGVPRGGWRVETSEWCRIWEKKRKSEREDEWRRFKHHLTGLWIIVKRPLHDGSLNRTAMWVDRINRTSKESYIRRIVFARGEIALEVES